MLIRALLLLPLLTATLWEGTEAARILFLIPMTSKSEKEVYTPLIDALGKRGHQVTVTSGVKSKYESKNVKELIPLRLEEFLGAGWEMNPLDLRRNVGRYPSLGVTFSEYGYNIVGCKKVFENPEFQKVIQEQYDLVFSNYFFGHCLDGILYKIGAPYIYVNSMIPIPYVYELTGGSLPASFVPFALGPPKSGGKMSFLERLENVLLDLHFTWFTVNDQVPAMEKVYRKYLGEDIPGGREIQKNASMIFGNAHFTINAPVPVLPDVVEVGGMHCRAAKPLPKELDEFLSGAKDGFIYFSMGSMLKSTSFSEELRKMFLSVFSKLKQRVLWKFEEKIEGLPPNVRIGNWLPQQDILGHPNIRMFITHGGALSTQEAIYHGVPLISLPVFADQDSNANTAQQKGFAIALEILELDAIKLSKAIQDILTVPQYAQKAKEISSHFKDQPQPPVERAVFWSEYVIRHKGTKHLQSSARQLSFIEYYLLDVVAFLLLLLVAVLSLAVVLIKSVFRLVLPRAGHKAKQQ